MHLLKGTNKSVFIFDFDGVLCDSIAECMIVSLNTYRSAFSSSTGDITNSMREYFYNYRYLVRPAGEYFLIWESYYHNKNFKKITFEDMKKTMIVQINEFQNMFYVYRQRMKQNIDYWISLHKCYSNTLQFFKKYRKNIFILTNKDKDSVEKISSAHGYSDRINEIYSKEISTDKSKLLNELLNNNKHLYNGYNIIYIDDNIKNLNIISTLNIPNLICIHARWGYCDNFVNKSYFHINDIIEIDEVLKSVYE
ncbi:uncharacterized protein METZ01_LOCUS401202 [marine metagenome]|uniref:Uncharacterized protein n=1 Tax=marine metagenome TaxID=408172 RepID=A0A382VR50_9ZZZZ